MAIAKTLSAAASGDRDTANQNTLVKPTEAQLRYAQFHHKRRAQAVKHRIDRLHQTPLEVVLSIGKIRRETLETLTPYEGDDGYSSVATEATSDIEIKAIRLRRPKISAGRRAFLKHSKRAYRRRRKDIENHGYRGYFLDESFEKEEKQGETTEGDFASDTDDHSDNERNQLHEGQGAANLNQVFATLPKHHNSQRRRRKKGGKKAFRRAKSNSGADDSYQRFQAACHAMMRNIQTSQDKAALPAIAAPSKRWKRSEAHVAAAEGLKQAGFYKYKTSGFVAGRKKSDKNSALLLSYKYYQQNQSSFAMDRGATWLTHLPAKQAKSSQGNNYFFQSMDQLPHIQQGTSFDENDNYNYTGDGDESTSTLAMRRPGRQKFNRLVAYVQHKLIEKEKKEGRKQQQILQINSVESDAPPPQIIGQNRTREIVELLSPNSHQTTPSRIRQMADSIEGKGGTPKMKLQKGTPFSELSNFSSVGSQHRRKRRKSKYVPRMRLRDFVVEGSSNDEDAPTPLPRKKLSERFLPGESNEVQPEEVQPTVVAKTQKGLPPSPPRKMKLRDSIPGEQQSQYATDSQGRMSTDRTREMANAFEVDDNANDNSESHVQQIRKSLEPDRTPKMKLKGDFDRIDEKKVAEYGDDSPMAISRSSVDRLSKQFQSPPTEEQLEDFNRSRGPSRDVVDEFSKHIDPRIYEQFESMGVDPQQANPRYSMSSSTQGTDHKSRGSGAGDKRQSSSSNVTEFFARIRGEQQERQNELQQEGGSSGNNSSNYPLESVSHPKSPSEHSDAVSELSKESNVSGLWNRGRTSISAMTSNLNTIAENKGKGFLSPDVIGKGAGLLSPDVIGKATSGLFNKFRGVPENSVQEESAPVSVGKLPHDAFQPKQKASFNHGTPQKQEQQPEMAPHPSDQSHSIDDLDALRNYRKTRASMSPETADDVSEASSFHALPDQIREVVQNSGGKVSPSAAAAAAAAATATNEGGLPPRFVSPNRSSTMSQSTPPSELSTDQYKRAHAKFLENSDLLGGEMEHRTIIDTDETGSDYSDAHKGMDPSVLASLMMSPDILQKRLKQAIGVVEQQKWDQVLFLINANPWLAEMKELTTNQFLLHKLAFFGTGSNPAPMSLSEQLITKFPSAVHKFDQDGNVPLHLASAAGNVEMIKMLGEKFSSGASIRNEDGMLPLHFSIASFADFDGDRLLPMETIKTVLNLFPQGIAIADNDGNLPLHVASECLEGGVGVDVVYLLMDEAERQLQDPFGVRFRNKIKLEELLDDGDEKSQGDMSTHNIKAMESMMEDDEDLQCTMVLNEFDETPLLAAIRSQKGWEMIEALVSGPGGRKAALKEDSDKNNALHLLVGEFQDPTAAMSILKIVPETAFHRNAQGILPIEMACMVMMPEEVILGIALVDLPINIDDRDGIRVYKDRGQSWAFLTGDCDDHMVHVVEEILSICSFQQLQELCFWKEDGAEQNVLDRATPKCQEAMNRALRFLGRFEFLGEGPLFSDMQTGFKAFDALDFGGNEEGKPVLLECYQNELDFENRVYTMFDISLESQFVEEVNVYVEHAEEENGAGDDDDDEKQQQQRCVAIERPRQTLKEIVQGMTENGTYESGNSEKRMKYSAKICSVLKLIGKALRHLHEAGVVHGNVSTETCGKFEDSSWKLMERLGVQAIGKPFNPGRFHHSFPPESLEPLSAENDPEEQQGDTVFDSDRPLVSFSQDFVADVSTDIWGFGKTCYETLVGKPLIEFDTNSSDSPSDDVVALLQTMEWNVANMETVFGDLLQSGIGESGADMITACLFPSPGDRPVDMDEILNNPFWQEMRKHRSPRKGRNRRSGESVSTSLSLLTDVDRYEV